jgi:hypothetical protein
LVLPFDDELRMLRTLPDADDPRLRADHVFRLPRLPARDPPGPGDRPRRLARERRPTDDDDDDPAGRDGSLGVAFTKFRNRFATGACSPVPSPLWSTSLTR